MAIIGQKPQVKSATPTVHATYPIPSGQHYQGHGSENRLTLLSVNRTYGTKAPEQIVSPNMSDMKNLSNIIARINTKPILAKVYAPNEGASLVHDLQNLLGL